MKNMMTVEEAHELLETEGVLTIRKQVEKGCYVGTFIKGENRNTYYISRYWFYHHKLGWQQWKIEEYHRTARGEYWLAYDPNAKRKKGTDGEGKQKDYLA